MFSINEKNSVEQILAIFEYLIGVDQIQNINIILPKAILSNYPNKSFLLSQKIDIKTETTDKDRPSHYILTIVEKGDNFAKLYTEDFAKNYDEFDNKPISFNIGLKDIGFIKKFINNLYPYSLNVKTI